MKDIARKKVKLRKVPKKRSGGEYMAKKSEKMNSKSARRIQSSQDKKGTKGDSGFKERTTRAAARNSKKK